jgi:hypothetical protein
MKLEQAIKKCKRNQQLCFRPVEWSKRGDELAYVVRRGIIQWTTDPEQLAVLGNRVQVLLGEFECLTLDELRSEAVLATTGIET